MRWRYLFTCALLLLWTPGTLQAREPQTYPERGVQVFLGLDDTSAPTQVQDGRAQDIQNVVLDVSRSARQRDGVSLVVPVDSEGLVATDTLDIPDEAFCTVTGLYYTKLSSGTEDTIATCGNRLYQLNGITSWDEVLGPPTITAGQNNQFTWTVALDNMVGTNDVDTPILFDGTTATALTQTGLSDPIQHAKTVLFFKNYLK